MTWPIIRSRSGDGENSLLSLHVNRGKRSVVLDLRRPEGVQAYLDLAARSDVVIEAMRPGALAKRGITLERLHAGNPALVFCCISGYGSTGPYRDLPSHGIAYDTWAGNVAVQRDDQGFTYIPEHASIGIHAGPAYGALAVLAAVIAARTSGRGCAMDLAQSDAAAYFDWWRIESWRSYERSEEEVHGGPADEGTRRPPGTSGMKEGVRYQIYATSDGHVIFMASEQAFWRNFCEGIDRPDLYERWPGATYGDHARGNDELRAILTGVFAARTGVEWIAFGRTHNVPIAPVNTPRTVMDDPQFADRFQWLPKEDYDADMLPFPVKWMGGTLAPPGAAPAIGEHTAAVLAAVAGYDEARIGALRDEGVLG
jgi:crotonobetainyl-CoA:carnitine CoA-transferase CaiB-like acyl-CoA transferase